MTHRSATSFAAGLAVAAFVAISVPPRHVTVAAAQGQPGAAPDVAKLAQEVAALRADVERLKQVVPDQSHAMSDVAWHYSNLWFAGEQGNWDLARFMFDETRSHLRWASRIIPVRKDPAGREVDVKALLEAVEQTSLKDLDASVTAKDKPKFEAAYRQMLTSCVACHQAVGKPFIRPRVPESVDSHVITFEPPEGGAAKP